MQVSDFMPMGIYYPNKTVSLLSTINGQQLDSAYIFEVQLKQPYIYKYCLNLFNWLFHCSNHPYENYRDKLEMCTPDTFTPSFIKEMPLTMGSYI